MMKKTILAFAMLLAFSASADEPKKQEPISVMAPKSLAKYDPNSGEWTLEKGAKAEEVMTALLREISNLQSSLQKCESAQEKKKTK